MLRLNKSPYTWKSCLTTSIIYSRAIMKLYSGNDNGDDNDRYETIAGDVRVNTLCKNRTFTSRVIWSVNQSFKLAYFEACELGWSLSRLELYYWCASNFFGFSKSNCLVSSWVKIEKCKHRLLFNGALWHKEILTELTRIDMMYLLQSIKYRPCYKSRD